MPTRRQATLFLPPSSAENVEAIRASFNPVQASLIRAHVTLCREDEVTDWEQFKSQMSLVRPLSLQLTFSHLVREGDLVYAGVEDSHKFHELRNQVLSAKPGTTRKHDPHLTLVHPRNGKCSDDTYAKLQTQFKPFTANLDTITIIEQVDGGIWQEVFRCSN